MKRFLLSSLVFLCTSTISASFLWPSLGMRHGVTAIGVWIAIIIGLGIELVCLKKLVTNEPFTRVFWVSLGMNIISAAFGMAFISLMDVSSSFLGISWLWHMLIMYAMTVFINICTEGLVVLYFFPAINKQRLLYLLMLANALSVAIGLLVTKLL